MASIESALLFLLKADTGLAVTVADRIYVTDNMPPDNVYPALCFWAMTSNPILNMQGLSGLTQATFQFHFYAKQFADVNAIRRSLYRILSGFVGTIEPTPGDFVDVQSILPTDGRSVSFTQEMLLNGYEVEFRILYSECF